MLQEALLSAFRHRLTDSPPRRGVRVCAPHRVAEEVGGAEVNAAVDVRSWHAGGSAPPEG